MPGIEATLQSKIINDLKKHGLLPIKIIKANISGIADILVILGGGRHVWIEVKAPEGKESAIQKFRREQLTMLGDTCYVVYSYEQFISIITPLYDGTRRNTGGAAQI